jgi:starch synthase
MQAQRYGTLPIAHATGGLADTIDDGETGFLFSDLSGEGLFSACRRAFDVFADDDVLTEMRQAAMARCFHWSGAAAEYETLYERLVGRGVAHNASPVAQPRRRKSLADVSLAAAA